MLHLLDSVLLEDDDDDALYYIIDELLVLVCGVSEVIWMNIIWWVARDTGTQRDTGWTRRPYSLSTL